MFFSADALVREDIAYLSIRPNFVRLMDKGAQVSRVHGIYPSVTYPAHATLLTGCYPGKHGVLTNTSFKTVDDGYYSWQTDFSLFKVEDLFAAAKRAGCTTASVYWPTMGNNPNIDYLVNEYFFPLPEEEMLETFRKFGANEATLEVIKENEDRFHRKETPWKERVTKENSYEDFTNGCACSLIRRYQPDFMVMHNCVVDATRHNFGAFSDELPRALDMLDDWLGEIIEAMEDAGVFENTDFIILSDHGQMRFTMEAHPNVLLKDAGFIQVNEAGEVVDWQAFSLFDCSSSTVYLKDKNDRELHDRVERCLRQAAESGKYGIEAVYTEEETRLRYHYYGDFSFVLEAASGYWHTQDWNGPVVQPYQHGLCGSHGYLPEKGPWPVFFGRGPSFKPGAVVPMAEMVDIAPTIARVLKSDLPEAEGRCMTELLK